MILFGGFGDARGNFNGVLSPCPFGKRYAGYPRKTPAAAQPGDGAASHSFSLLLHNSVGISKDAA